MLPQCVGVFLHLYSILQHLLNIRQLHAYLWKLYILKLKWHYVHSQYHILLIYSATVTPTGTITSYNSICYILSSSDSHCLKQVFILLNNRCVTFGGLFTPATK